MEIAFAQVGRESPKGWLASLELVASQRGSRTVLGRNRHRGPLRVQRPFYPEGGICHAYILHPPGGLVAGDELDIRVHCEAGTQLLVTTPSAGRTYGSNREKLEQRQRVFIRVEPDARCEWLPQESIVFNQAEAKNNVCVSLAEKANFSAWEITCLGRPAASEDFHGGCLSQCLEVWREDRPLLIERSEYVGGSALLQAPWGIGGARVVGTLVSTATEAGVERLREVVAQTNDRASCLTGGEMPFSQPLVAVTTLPELMVVRAFGANAAAVKAVFLALWRSMRLAQSGREAAAPRVWFT